MNHNSAIQEVLAMLFIQVAMLAGTFLMITGFVGDVDLRPPPEYSDDED